MLDVVAFAEIEIALLPSAVRKRSGYRPNHKHPRTGEFFMGEISFENGFVDPGDIARARIRIITTNEDLDALLKFGSWSVWEAVTHVAHARIIELNSREPSNT